MCETSAMTIRNARTTSHYPPLQLAGTLMFASSARTDIWVSLTISANSPDLSQQCRSSRQPKDEEKSSCCHCLVVFLVTLGNRIQKIAALNVSFCSGHAKWQNSALHVSAMAVFDIEFDFVVFPTMIQRKYRVS